MHVSRRSAHLLCLTRTLAGAPMASSWITPGGSSSVDGASFSSKCSLRNRHSSQRGSGDSISMHQRALCALPPGCWKCGVRDKGRSAFCRGCGGIQPLELGLDHFRALGL